MVRPVAACTPSSNNGCVSKPARCRARVMRSTLPARPPRISCFSATSPCGGS
jgi:hypothetical protein